MARFNMKETIRNILEKVDSSPRGSNPRDGAGKQRMQQEVNNNVFNYPANPRLASSQPGGRTPTNTARGQPKPPSPRSPPPSKTPSPMDVEPPRTLSPRTPSPQRPSRPIPSPSPQGPLDAGRPAPEQSAARVFKRQRALFLAQQQAPRECICFRAHSQVACCSCGLLIAGRVRIQCSVHPNTIHLMDVERCPECCSATLTELRTT